MRITLNLPDALGRAARERAAEEGVTFTSFLEDALRQRLAQPQPTHDVSPLPTYRPSNPGTFVDLDDTSAVLDALDHPA